MLRGGGNGGVKKLIVCVCARGGCLGCSGQKRGVAAVRVLVHVWVNKGRKGQPGRGDSGSEVLKHKISLSPSLSLLLGQTQSNSNLCDFTAHRIPKTLTALCWGGGVMKGWEGEMEGMRKNAEMDGWSGRRYKHASDSGKWRWTDWKRNKQLTTDQKEKRQALKRSVYCTSKLF